MPKETLKNLERDAERLLFAGAQAARQDPALEAARAKLAPLGPKAPAIAKVVEQVEKVQRAAPKAAAAELLNLAALMMQVRGAQAAPLAAPEGELAPLPRTEPMGSPLSPVELSALVGALTGAEDARHRARTIEEAVERGAFRDLRLLPFSVAALRDSVISGVVESQLLPRLGGAVVPELRASLNLQGRTTDAARLRALARIEGKAAQPLLLEAVEKGSPELRAAAIRSLARIDMAVAEPIALRLLDGDRSTEVKKAAAAALEGASSEAALGALLKSFREEAELRQAVKEPLATFQHPQTTDRVLALLTPELLSLGPLEARKPKAKAAKADEREARAHQDQVELLRMALELLGERQDQDTTPFLLRVFREHKLEEVRDAAARALLMRGYEDASGVLTPSLFRADYDFQNSFIDRHLKQDPARSFDRLGRFLARAHLKPGGSVEFAHSLLFWLLPLPDAIGYEDEHAELRGEEATGREALTVQALVNADPRWGDALIALMDHPKLDREVLKLIAVARPPQALEPLLKLTAAARRERFGDCVNTLVQYKDERIPKILMELLALPGPLWRRIPICAGLRTYDDPAAAPLLKAWMQREKRLDQTAKDEFTELVRFLERDRSLTTGV